MNKPSFALLSAAALLSFTVATAQTPSTLQPRPKARTATPAPRVETKATAPDLQLYGSIIGSFFEPGSYYVDAGALYTFNLQSPKAITVEKSGVHTYGGGTYAQGSYYHTDYTEGSDSQTVTFPIRLYQHSTADWSQTRLAYGYAFTSIPCDLTFDPETQQLYGLFSDDGYTGQYKTLGRVKVTTSALYGYLYECDPIATLPEKMVAITANRQGQLYAFGVSGKLYTLDKFTGAATMLFDTQVETAGVFQSATCDYSTGKLYWATPYNDYYDTGIYEVDPEAKSASLVADFGYDYGTGTCDQFTGIYLKQDLSLQAVPDTVTSLTLTPSGTQGLAASFLMPSADVDGNALSGTLTYSVYLGGAKAAEGQAAAGTTANVSLTAGSEGEQTVSVYVTLPATTDKPAATSLPARASIYLGADEPLAPTGVKAVASGYDVSVSWTAPTQTVHGAPIDASSLTYTVWRFVSGAASDSVCVAQNIAATTCTDHIASTEKLSYYYKVVALNGTKQSAAAQSEPIALGNTIALPFYDEFEQDPFSTYGFTALDVNEDGSTWTYNADNQNVNYEPSAENAADDWFVTAPFAVRAGAVYRFSFDARGSYLTELISASLGTAPEATSLTTEIVPTTELTRMQTKTLTGSWRASADGQCYFGIHAESGANLGTVRVDNLRIIEYTTDAPEAVGDFTVTPGEKGATKATVSFSAPTKTLGGTALTGQLTIAISRDGTVLTTLTGVNPGQACSYEDASVATGTHTYTAVATTADGKESVEAAETRFIGLDVPGSVRNLRAVEDLDHEGLIHLTWDAPAAGKNGGYIDPTALTYYVSSGVSGSSDLNIGNKTSYDDQLSVNGRQTYQAYSVYAANSAGNARTEVWRTVTAIAGPALVAPFYESFASSSVKDPWLTKMTNGEIGEAYCYATGYGEYTSPQDADGGMQSFSAEAVGKSVRIESPKIDLRSLARPQLRFYAFLSGEGDSLTVSVSPEYKGFETKLKINTADRTPGWYAYTIDLSAYRESRFVQIGFEGKSVVTTTDFADFDNVAIQDPADHDLMASAFSGPAELATEESGAFTLTLRNNTATAVSGSDYDVVLYKNGSELTRTAGKDVAADAKTTVSLVAAPSVLDPEQSAYWAVIDYAADENTSNNTSDTLAVKVVLPDYPTPTALTASGTTEGIALAWTAPDLVNRPNQSTTDTFDDYKQFIIDGIGAWTVVDGDKQTTKRITLSSLFGPLQYDHAGEAMAYQVFNVNSAGIPLASWDPHSGDQMLVCFAGSASSGTTQPNDDWLISPELDGSAQTIRFYAKAGQGGNYIPERMQLLYSTTDKDTASFVRVGETVDVSNVSGWEEHRFDVPEGAKYFAIRCVSEDKLALMIDDVTYIAAGAVPQPLTLQGYNVYRDDRQLNAAPVSENSYVDTSVEYMQDYVYRVTAVYDAGESLPSNAVAVKNTTGISNVATATVSVKAGKGCIVVLGAEGQTVGVYNADGRQVARIVAAGSERIAVGAGLYLVRIGKTTQKIVVK